MGACAIVLAAALSAGGAGGSGINPVRAESCDRIELNHCYTDGGHHSFDQLIFWRETPDGGRYPLGFVVLKKHKSRWISSRNGWHVAVWSHEKSVWSKEKNDSTPVVAVYSVKSRSFSETWTIGDPETEWRNKSLDISNPWHDF